MYDCSALGDTPGSSKAIPAHKGRGVDFAAHFLCRVPVFAPVENPGASRAVLQDAKGPGHTRLSATAQIIAFLGAPHVAAIIGVLVGAGALGLTAVGVRQFTPETLELGMARAVVLMVIGMVAAFVALLLYYLFVRAALVPFGLGLVTGFTVPALFALFRTSGLSKSSTARR